MKSLVLCAGLLTAPLATAPLTGCEGAGALQELLGFVFKMGGPHLKGLVSGLGLDSSIVDSIFSVIDGKSVTDAAMDLVRSKVPSSLASVLDEARAGTPITTLLEGKKGAALVEEVAPSTYERWTDFSEEADQVVASMVAFTEAFNAQDAEGTLAGLTFPYWDDQKQYATSSDFRTDLEAVWQNSEGVTVEVALDLVDHVPSEAFEQADSIGGVAVTQAMRDYVKKVLGTTPGFVSIGSLEMNFPELGDSASVNQLVVTKKVGDRWRMAASLEYDKQE